MRGKLPLNSLEAERAVLSAILIDADAFNRVSDFLTADHFYSYEHQVLFQACADVAASGKRIDIVSTIARLNDTNQATKVGGSAYLAEIADATPFVANVRDHAKIVRDKWRLRRVIAECQRIAAEGYGEVDDASLFVEKAEQAIFNLNQSSQSDSTITMFDSLTGVFRRLQETDGIEDGFTTGIDDLDTFLGRLKPGQLTITGALSSVGKSALAMNVAVNVARLNPKSSVLVFSLEMTHEDLSTRALFCEARVDNSKLSRMSRLNDAEWAKLAKCVGNVGLRNVWIDDQVDLSLPAMQAKVRRSISESRKLGREGMLVVVDYLQLMNGRHGLAKSDTREREMAILAKGLKDMAKACDVHIIALAQLNDDGSRRGDEDKKPRLSDLRESKAIGMCADKVVLIHNPAAVARSQQIRNSDERQDGPLPAEPVELIIAKNRGGMTGSIEAVFHPSFTRFENKPKDDCKQH